DKNKTFSQSIYLLAEYASIASGFLIFIQLAGTLIPVDFASWEWLQVWLGLCLLLPRNGLDIVAIRSAYRHQKHLREWTAIVLITRLLLSIPAMLLMISAGKLLGIDQPAIAILMMTIPISATVPDIAARVQGRFRKHAFIISIKNIVFLTMLMFGKVTNLNQIAELYFLNEVIESLMCWADAWQFRALPGGRWIILLRRGGRGILARSTNQSLGRWLRVFSYNADAIFLGLMAPGAWSMIAPGRRLMMSFVMPLGNWLGSTGHQMTHWPSIKIVSCDCIFRRICLATTFCLLIFAAAVPAIPLFNSNSDIWLIVFARAGVIAYGFWLMAAQAAMRQDKSAWITPALLTAGSLFIAMAVSFSMQMQYSLILILLLEWAAIGISREFIFRSIDAKNLPGVLLNLKAVLSTQRIKRKHQKKAA
ncbi:MAG: hypothetical protein ACKO0V_14005, partial [bacterium]